MKGQESARFRWHANRATNRIGSLSSLNNQLRYL